MKTRTTVITVSLILMCAAVVYASNAGWNIAEKPPVSTIGPLFIASVGRDIVQVLIAIFILFLIVAGVKGATQEARFRRERGVMDKVFSQVRGDEPYAVVALGEGIRISNIDGFEFKTEEFVKIRWFILRPGQHVMTVHFDVKLPAFAPGTSCTVSLPKPLPKELNLNEGSTNGLAALINGRWLSAQDADVCSPGDLGIIFLSGRTHSIEIRLVDRQSCAQGFAEKIRACISPEKSPIPVPNCFLPGEANRT